MAGFFNKKNFIRGALALVTVAVIMLVMPRADVQSYSYEQGQPWRYPLLTASFDTPIMRDSVTASQLRDSIDRAFTPFVRRDNGIAERSALRFENAVREQLSVKDRHLLSGILAQVYEEGIVETGLYDQIRLEGTPMLRMVDTDDPSGVVNEIDAAAMLTPARAYRFIDSTYRAQTPPGTLIPEDVGEALNVCLVANVVIDSVADAKYRNQEYLNFTGAQGVIKKGQRIVDRGEIVTPQIYTNLNTYLDMLAREHDTTNTDTYFAFGQALYLLIAVVLLYFFLAFYRPRFYANMRQMTFLMTCITLFAIFAVVMFNHVAYGIYLVPFSLVPVVVLTFFDSRTAIFSLLITVLICAMIATEPLQFIFLEMSAGLVATYSIHHMSRRSQLLRAALLTFITYCLCYLAMCLLLHGTLTGFSFRIIFSFAVNSVILSFAYILIVVIEKLFGFTSMVTLVELSDINNRLLRRLAEVAPGTFQHSMQVSTLAAEAARAVGANALLVRTGALYHDIGKMESPIFFTENQHGINPHDGLDPETSARKIISHVTTGLSLAAKEKLPQLIRDFIAQHHGKGITRYFYNTAVNNSADGNVDPAPYTYPGPNPKSKETTILMMADAVEASSRSLKDFSDQSINNLIDRIIDNQMSSGLYKDSKLTFRDIETIKETFKKRLGTIYHSRVEYPELKKKASQEESAPAAPSAETPSTAPSAETPSAHPSAETGSASPYAESASAQSPQK